MLAIWLGVEADPHYIGFGRKNNPKRKTLQKL
jgi:hypothetical protein